MTNLAKFPVFKPVPGGYVFAPPTGWLFGSRKYYLATEEQKTALLAIFTASSRGVLWIMGIAWIALTALGTALWLWAHRSGHADPALAGLIAMIATILSVYPALVAGQQMVLRRLRPVLATLSPTNERITALEMRQAILAANAGQSCAISPVRRRIIRIGALLVIVGKIGGMIARAADLAGADHLNFATFYQANVNLSGALDVALIVVMGMLFARFGRVPARA